MFKKEIYIMPDSSNLITVSEGEKEHIIYGPASVQVRDNEGDLIKAEALEDALPQLIRRGRFSKQHKDIIVGEILPMYKASNGHIYKTEVRTPTADDVKLFSWLDKNTPALFTVGNVYGDSREGRLTRESINKGELDSLSISGAKLDGSMGEVTRMDLDAVTICERGMNPYAKFKTIAKADLINKPFAGYEDFQACLRANSDKTNPEAYCAAIHHTSTGKWPSEKMEKYWAKSRSTDSETEKGCKPKVNKMPEDEAVAPEQPPEVEDEEVVEEVVDTAEQIQALAEQVQEVVTEVAEMKKLFVEEDTPEEEEPEEDEEMEKSEVGKVLKDLQKTVKEIRKSLRVEKAETPRPEAETNDPIQTEEVNLLEKAERLAKSGKHTSVKTFIKEFKREVM